VFEFLDVNNLIKILKVDKEFNKNGKLNCVWKIQLKEYGLSTGRQKLDISL
jgi:hypothetical protein